MKQEYKEILTEICNRKGSYKLNILIDELKLMKHLPPNAVYEIDRKKTLPGKRTAVFDCLKQQEEIIFRDIESIFERNKWADGVEIIRQGRNGLKPFLFAVNKPTSLFTGREEKIETIHKIVSQNNKQPNGQDESSIVVCGLGGIGKTQLILSYIHKYKSAFDSIIWINAESEISLKTSFYNLASILEIASETHTFEILAKKVAQKVSTFGSKNLFVFDNADEINPNELLPIDFENYFFLITSRRSDWYKSKIIHLEELKEEEAIQFVERSLKTNVNKETDGLMEFIFALQCFPLALRQATSYLKMKNKLTTEIYTFKSYLSELETNTENTKKLFNYIQKDTKSMGKIGEVNMLNTFTTWQITFDKIKHVRYGESVNTVSKGSIKSTHVNDNGGMEPLSSRMLNIAAYYLSDNIPVELFNDNENEDELSWAIRLLEQFSLVTISQGMMKVHKLVQQVTRLNLLDENKAENFITAAAELLVKKCPLHDTNTKAISIKQVLLPHLTEIMKHVKHLKNQLKEEKFFNIICPVLECLVDIYFNLGEETLLKNVGDELLSIQEERYGSENHQMCYAINHLALAYADLGDPQKSKTLLERALKIQELHYGSDHFQLATTLVHLANAYINLGDPQKSKTLLERALKIQVLHYGPDHFQLATTLVNLAFAYINLGDPQKSKTLLERALKIQELHYGPDHFEVATTLVNLARSYANLGDPQKSKTLLERALEIQELRYGPDHFQLAATVGNLALAYSDLGDPKRSKTLLERALKVQELHYGPDHFQLAATIGNLALAYSDLGDPQKSKTLLERALEIQELRYGPDHFQLAATVGNLARAYANLGDPQKSKTLFERALKIQEFHYGPDHFQLATTFVNLALVYSDLGDPQKSKTLLERALKIKELHYGPDHFEVAATLVNLARAFAKLGDPQESKTLLERALKIKEHHYGPDHFQLATTLVNLAFAYINLGDPQKSKILLERALNIEELHYGPDHFEVTTTLVNLAFAYADLGDPQTSKTLLERALKIQELHYGVYNYQVALTSWHLARCKCRLNEPHKAKKLLKIALPVIEQHYGYNHQHSIQMRLELSEL